MIKENNQKNKKENLDIEDLPKVWNEYAKVYDKVMQAPIYKKMADALFESLIPCPGGIVHDGGCGIGYYFKGIFEKTQASKIIATDISSEMIEKAKKTLLSLSEKYHDKVEFYQMDLTKEWPKGEFDAQIFQFVLNYMPENKWQRSIENAYKTTKPGGYVYSSTLFRGLSINDVAKKHTLEEGLNVPISSFLAILKAKNIMKVFDKLTEEEKIILPDREEYIDYHKKIGFNNVEMVKEIFWGIGAIIRAQK